MTEPWFPDPNLFGALYGSLAGGLGGTLLGCLGAAAGKLVPRGLGRTWIVGTLCLFLALGVLQLLVGLVALAASQPYGIWFPILLTGIVFSTAAGAQLPAVFRGYAVAEQRRLDAQVLRNG